jgi:hypothetical protein
MKLAKTLAEADGPLNGGNAPQPSCYGPHRKINASSAQGMNGRILNADERFP